MNEFLKDSISNGNKYEQALIRKWWYEEHEAKGLLVWEYHLERRYQDAILFPNIDSTGEEANGKNTSKLYPLKNQEVVLCEAKLTLTPELIGQALVYKQFALHAGAIVTNCIIFYETAHHTMITVAEELGLSVYPIYTKEGEA